MALSLALAVLLGLVVRPVCDALAAGHAPDGGRALLAQLADAPGADTVHRHGHDDGPCCSSVGDGSLVRPLDAAAVAGAGAQPLIARHPAWRVQDPYRGGPLLAAAQSVLFPLAFHARSAPLRR